MPDRVVGLFLETLAQELGTGWPPVDDPHGAAGARDRRDAGGVLDLGGGVKPGSVRAEGGQQPGGEHGPRAGQAGKHGGVGMLGDQVGDGVINGRDMLADGQEHVGQHGRFQDGGLEDGGVGGESFPAILIATSPFWDGGLEDGGVGGEGVSVADDLKPMGDDRRFPTSMRDVKLAQRLRVGLFHGVERGILTQQVAGHGRKQILAADLQEQGNTA